MKGKFTISIPVTPENQDGINALVAWNESIPTVYFLDICSISRIKTRLSKGEGEDAVGDHYAALLRRIDLAHNAISYFPALMEKASNQQTRWTVDQLLDEASRDMDAIEAFFERAILQEPREFVFSYIRELNGVHPELLGESYHEFLRFVNCSKIYNPVASERRFQVAESICEEATRLGIPRVHPVVLASLACVYGCQPAKKVMKFKKNMNEFNPSNALGDIQTIQRIGQLCHMIEEAGREGLGRYLRGCFITADEQLEKFYNYFTVDEVKTDILEDGSRNEFNLTVKGRYMLPDLFGENGEVRDSACEQELLKIYELIGLS
ncbi:MAG: hypothetical protein K0S46_1904 [Moraxellaceae bacterium]|nr:hypothetical protein [Moraxellaceae bacterium]